MRRALLPWVMVCLMAGCASTPDVTYKYYPSRLQATATVTQTVDCTTDKKSLIVINTPSMNSVYSADYSQSPYSIQIKKLAGTIADSDFALNWFDDGRLKSVNASTTGQGEAVVKSAISLIGAVAAVGGGAAPTSPTGLPECTVVTNWGNGKPVTLTYSQVIDFVKAAAAPQQLKPTPQSAALWNSLHNQLPPLAVKVDQQAPNNSGASYGSSGDDLLLTLQKTNTAEVSIVSSGSAIFTSIVTLPQTTTYQLPIPKSAVFGKQTFSLTLAESGAITAIDYGKLSGASGALNAATSIAGAAAPESTATKAADVKSQADLIAQQQRLVRCQAQPDKCT